MKKSNQKIFMSLFIVIIFGMSSIAFVVSSFSGSSDTQQQTQKLNSYVIDGDIDPAVENTYVNAGFTFLKLYKNENTSSDIIPYVNQAPDTFKTNNGQTQLIVQKIDSGTSYVKILNVNGEHDIFNVTVGNIFDGLCTHLVALPAECALHGLEI